MQLDRLVCATRCVVVVMLACLPGTLPRHALAEGGDEELLVDRALRLILRKGPRFSAKVEAAAQVLGRTPVGDGEMLLRAGVTLMADAPETAGWLVLRGADTAWAGGGVRDEVHARVESLLSRADASAAARAAWAAAGFRVGYRPDEAPALLTAVWPPSPLVSAVLRREAASGPHEGGGASPDEGGAALQRLLERQLPVARALDRAESDDPAKMRAGLDALLSMGDAALEVLRHEARSAAGGVPPGRIPRATRAILALGLLGRHEATADLIAALDAPDGWVQVAAATALGDLGDPAAAIALCRKITYRGDILRPRDQWDYPGPQETTVSPEDWPGVEYYVIDCAAADALLRLGVRGAAGWLIRNRLDPAKANYRIRVLQDAVDALRRALPAANVAAYNVDAGLPRRRDAFEALSRWWREHRDDPDLLAVTFDAADAGFRREARRMVERLRGRRAIELLIGHESCELLGPAITPTLLETLAVARDRRFRTEITRALGLVGDKRAVAPLLSLMRARKAFVRAEAAVSAASYVGRDDRVVPALLALLDDPEPAPRMAALSALAASPPSDDVRQAVEDHSPAAYQAAFGMEDRDYRMAWTVTMLVQEGQAHWPVIRTGLRHEERYVRQAWWDLLCRALPLRRGLYDATTQPFEPAWVPVDETRVLEALAERRTP